LGAAEYSRHSERDVLFEAPETFLNGSRLSSRDLPEGFAGQDSANAIIIIETRNYIRQE
jgi:hypothetical protein